MGASFSSGVVYFLGFYVEGFFTDDKSIHPDPSQCSKEGAAAGHLEQSRQLRSSGESGDVPLDGSALLLELSALVGAAQLL